MQNKIERHYEIKFNRIDKENMYLTLLSASANGFDVIVILAFGVTPFVRG